MSGQMGMTAGLGLNPGGRPRPAVLPNPKAQYIQQTPPVALTKLASAQQQLQAQALRNQPPVQLAPQPQTMMRPQTTMAAPVQPIIRPQPQIVMPQVLPQPQIVPGPVTPIPLKYMAPGYAQLRDVFAATPRAGWTFSTGAKGGAR